MAGDGVTWGFAPTGAGAGAATAPGIFFGHGPHHGGQETPGLVSISVSKINSEDPSDLRSKGSLGKARGRISRKQRPRNSWG